MKHTREPWRIEQNITGAYGDRAVAPFILMGKFTGAFEFCVASVIGDVEDIDAQANARRIVACVNACAGTPTEWLELQHDPQLIEMAGEPDPMHVRIQRGIRHGIELLGANAKVSRLTEAMKAARERIVADRDSLVSGHNDPATGEVEPDALEWVKEYDDLLAQIDEAIGAESAR